MIAIGGILRRRVQLANVLSCEEHGPNGLIWMVQVQTNCEVYDDVASFHQDSVCCKGGGTVSEIRLHNSHEFIRKSVLVQK